MVLGPELTASEEEGLHDLAGEGSCSDEMIDGSSLLDPWKCPPYPWQAQVGGGCKSQKFRWGVEAVFSSEKSRLPVEAVVWHQTSSEPG